MHFLSKKFNQTKNELRFKRCNRKRIPKKLCCSRKNKNGRKNNPKRKKIKIFSKLEKRTNHRRRVKQIIWIYKFSSRSISNVFFNNRYSYNMDPNNDRS
eukprot:14007_4